MKRVSCEYCFKNFILINGKCPYCQKDFIGEDNTVICPSHTIVHKMDEEDNTQENLEEMEDPIFNEKSDSEE